MWKPGGLGANGRWGNGHMTWGCILNVTQGEESCCQSGMDDFVKFIYLYYFKFHMVYSMLMGPGVQHMVERLRYGRVGLWGGVARMEDQSEQVHCSEAQKKQGWGCRNKAFKNINLGNWGNLYFSVSIFLVRKKRKFFLRKSRWWDCGGFEKVWKATARNRRNSPGVTGLPAFAWYPLEML